MANSKEKSLFNSVTINPQGREELVGKRFLVVNQTSPKPKLSRIGDWHWKAGVIRCSSHVDIKDPELQVRKHDDDNTGVVIYESNLFQILNSNFDVTIQLIKKKFQTRNIIYLFIHLVVLFL